MRSKVIIRKQRQTHRQTVKHTDMCKLSALTGGNYLPAFWLIGLKSQWAYLIINHKLCTICLWTHSDGAHGGRYTLSLPTPPTSTPTYPHPPLPLPTPPTPTPTYHTHPYPTHPYPYLPQPTLPLPTPTPTYPYPPLPLPTYPPLPLPTPTHPYPYPHLLLPLPKPTWILTYPYLLYHIQLIQYPNLTPTRPIPETLADENV